MKDLCSRMEHEAHRKQTIDGCPTDAGRLLLEARCAILQLQYDLEETRKERDEYVKRVDEVLELIDKWRKAYHNVQGDML